MSSELDLLLERIRAVEAELHGIEVELRGRDGSNGLRSRVRLLEVEIKRQAQEDTRNQGTWRDAWLVILGVVITSAMALAGRAGEIVWDLLQLRR